MIPKTLHYCWFGQNRKTKLIDRCIKSWYSYCPDYKIIEWNESNFDFYQHPYLQWCHEKAKWAFLSDFARLLIVYQHGGLYFDTDVELIKQPDELLQYDAFFGFENKEYVATGLGFGAVAGFPILNDMIRQYETMNRLDDGSYPTIVCPSLNTEALKPFGLVCNGLLQTVSGATIFPSDYFNPYDDATGHLNLTSNTVSIHWYGKSWMSKRAIIRSRITQPFHRVFGIHCFDWLK